MIKFQGNGVGSKGKKQNKTKKQWDEFQQITHNVCSNNEIIRIRRQKFNGQCLRHSLAHILWEKARKSKKDCINTGSCLLKLREYIDKLLIKNVYAYL